jgi:hypothetical protein
MTREVWAREHLASYLAGGLTTDERFEIQERLKTDVDLAAELEGMRGVDERLRSLFAASKPPVELEDRVIRTLRSTTMPAPRGKKRSWPLRGLAVAASVLVLVLIGSMIVSQVAFLTGEQVAFLNKESAPERPAMLVAKGNLFSADDSRSMIEATDGDVYFDPMSMAGELTHRLSVHGGHAPAGQLTPDPDVAATKGRSSDSGKREEQLAQRGFEVSDAITKQKDAGIAMDWSEGWGRWRGAVPRDDSFVDPAKQSPAVPKSEKPTDGAMPHNFGLYFAPPASTSNPSAATYGNVHSLGKMTAGAAPENSSNSKGRGFGAPGFSAPSTAAGFGGGFVRGNSTTAPPAVAGGGSTLAAPKAEGGQALSAVPSPMPANQPAPPRAAPNVEYGAYAFTPTAPPAKTVAPNWYSPADAFKEMTKKGDSLGALGFRIADGEKKWDDNKAIEDQVAGAPGSDGRLSGRTGVRAGDQDRDGQAKGDDKKNSDAPAAPPAPEATRPDNGDPKAKATLDDIKNGTSQAKELPATQDPRPGESVQTPPPPEKQPGKVDPKQPEPKQAPVARRIVIRSGDIEFEVDSFDQAVGMIYMLIGKTKGGVIATTNSDKLANGKMRGAIVVRMPPDELDDFVFAMRKELGKIGELKNQRIGSQDVTKHYTDMESELRGLRVSEERLIVMLKETKGQLKDLLAVETQLAKTRTNIEKLEGELRYYANLAAMSTLTINLYEKEIRVAAGVVESERVQAGVETEDVDVAFQATKAAIDEFKGRIFRSDMKQSAAGQFNAVLQFDIAPESAGLMRDRLKQIGTVARLEIDRVQKVEGGGAPSRESKVKRGDTQFFVSIYNLANVAPRETVNATIVGGDVPGSYLKIRNLVAKLKGNLRNTSLQNSDARNVVAVLDFDIRRVDEPAVQAALAEAGEFLSRNIVRQAESDNVTDTKVRFALRLVSVGGITARESNNLSMAALDVAASYRKVRDAVVKAKGYMRNANLQEADKANINATLDFDVMRSDEDAILAVLAAAGEMLTRRVERRPEGENVTDAKIGFNVSMVSVASIPPREATQVQIAATDVPAAYARLREAATKAKAQIRAANLLENDRENMSANLEFDVLRTEEGEILAALAAAGETLGRRVDRQAGGVNVTDAKVLFKVDLVSANAIKPRDIYEFHIKVDRVEDKLKIFQALVAEAHGRIVDGPKKGKTANGKMVAKITYHVPLIAAGALAESFKSAGNVTGQDESKNPQAPEGKLALAEFRVMLFDVEPLVPNDEGFGAQLRNGMSVSLRGLTATITYLLAAIMFLGPWVLILWIVYVLARRLFGVPPAASSAAAASTPPPEPAKS